MKRIITALASFLLAGCTYYFPIDNDTPGIPEEEPGFELSASGIATMFARLPMGPAQLREVYDAVGMSSGNGYDEEYTLDRLMTVPGTGVGPGTRAALYEKPLRDMVREYVEAHTPTRAGVEDIMMLLTESGYQLYWPYSEDWDGKSYPVITFDPGYGAESNIGYALVAGADGTAFVSDTLVVTEAVAMQRPVWVVNSNSDAGFTPLELFKNDNGTKEDLNSVIAGSDLQSRPQGSQRKLLLKSFKMLRNYDSWFGGASEFFVKCGSVEGWTTSTDAELRLFNVGVTDFMIVVKRKWLDKELPYDAILVTDFTSQLERLAFLIIEDDGGQRTNWKCQAVVKVQSKSYGVELDIPYNEKDDVVWRGQLSARFFEQEDIVTGRFGDVICKFELE